MPSIDTFLTSGATALGLSLIVMYLLLTERIVPKGRLDEKQVQLDEAKAVARDALAIVKQQNDGVQPLLITVRELVELLKARR